MQLRQLAYLVRIIEMGSVSRASQVLHVAQPALSQQINQLEEELGVQLLHRSVRGVTPTDAGLAVYRQAQLILKQVEATRLIAAEADAGPAGTVSIGLPWTVASLLGLPLLREVRATLKAVRLEIVEGPSSVLGSLLAEGKIELAVLFDSAATSGLIVRPVLSEPLLFVGPPGSLAGKSSMTLEETAGFPLLLMSRPNGIREMIEQRFAAVGCKPNIAAQINAPALLIDAVRAELGYSILPACGLEEPIRRGEVDAIELEDGSLRRTVSICTSRLFTASRAAEHVHAIVHRLMRTAVEEWRWSASLLDSAS
jgi:DNA-binding transcriptional LysR family regulator